MTKKTQEVAGRTIAATRALADRLGFGEPDFIIFCGPLCVFRYQSTLHPTAADPQG
ncbi:hypothetical protein D9M68_999990 [compost metagenome]